MKHEWQLYLEPIDTHKLISNLHQDTIGRSIAIHSKMETEGAENLFPDTEGVDIAIIGVPENRGIRNFKPSRNEKNDKYPKPEDGPNIIRKEFYKLYNHYESIKIIDVGNIKRGNTINDTYVALQTIIEYFISNKILVIILGGGNDLVYSNFNAYEKLNKFVNVTCIDSVIDIKDSQDCMSDCFLNNIIMKKPNYLFNLTNIGYQSYMNNKKVLKTFDSMFFDAYRLGIAKECMDEMEPSIRNSDIISVDISSVKVSDAPGSTKPSPNGFSGNELCKISRYAGSSDRVSSFGIYEYNPATDRNLTTAKLIAHTLWYLMEGFYNRTNELPYKNKDNFIKYHVSSNIFEKDIIFYKSKLTNRWWMEVDCPEILRNKFSNCYLVSCSYKDYLTACNNDFPDRWIQVYKKIDISRI